MKPYHYLKVAEDQKSVSLYTRDSYADPFIHAKTWTGKIDVNEFKSLTEGLGSMEDETCYVCGNEIYNPDFKGLLGMCGPCTTGEADTI